MCYTSLYPVKNILRHISVTLTSQKKFFLQNFLQCMDRHIQGQGMRLIPDNVKSVFVQKRNSVLRP